MESQNANSFSICAMVVFVCLGHPAVCYRLHVEALHLLHCAVDGLWTLMTSSVVNILVHVFRGYV